VPNRVGVAQPVARTAFVVPTGFVVDTVVVTAALRAVEVDEHPVPNKMSTTAVTCRGPIPTSASWLFGSEAAR
jgi:hypothetical protein